MLMQRRKLTKTINVFAYEIILTHVYGHPHQQELLHRSNIVKYHVIFYCCSIANFAEKKREKEKESLFGYDTMILAGPKYPAHITRTYTILYCLQYRGRRSSIRSSFISLSFFSLSFLRRKEKRGPCGPKTRIKRGRKRVERTSESDILLDGRREREEGRKTEREIERRRERMKGERKREREIDYFLTQDDCVQRCVHTRDAIGHQDGTPDFSGPPTDKIINTECDIRVRPFVCQSIVQTRLPVRPLAFYFADIIRIETHLEHDPSQVCLSIIAIIVRRLLQ